MTGVPLPKELCTAIHATRVFSHYAYGDPLPCWARYVTEEGAAEWDDAIVVYARCQREDGHEGKHLAFDMTTGWKD